METRPTAHEALYTRYRAGTFAGIVGQEPVVETLRSAIRLERLPHALLFVGPRGTGKTSMARIVAKAANCTSLRDGEPCDACPSCLSIRAGRALDVVEMDAASNNRVDDMRELVSRTLTAPAALRRRVFIIDEVQRITQGWDVLLRTLEEPPTGVLFIFCTTDASSIRPAVLSRVARFDFRRLSEAEIAGKLRRILTAEGRHASEEAIALLARLAAGGMRDAETMLDSLLATETVEVSAEAVRDLLGLADDDTIAAFIAALLAHDAAAGLAILAQLDETGRDLRTFLDSVIGAVRDEIAARATQSEELVPLADVARRLVALDPTGATPGGLRFALEISLLASADVATPPLATDAPRPAPKPSPPATPVTPVTPAGVPAIDRSDPLATRFEALLGALGASHPPIRGLLASARPVSLDGEELIFAYPNRESFLRDAAQRRIGDMDAALSTVLERPVRARLDLDE